MKHLTLFACTIFLLLFSGVSHAANSTFMKQANRFFKPLPKVMESEQNPITSAKVKLGKMLFYETRLSVDGAVSCEKCHMFSLYGTDGLKKSIAADCKVAPRNAPTVLNAAGQISEHWTGNMKDVEEQAGKAMSNMPGGNYTDVVAKLDRIKGYVKLFKDAFPQDKSPVSIKNIGLAIGAFERTLVTPSPFDAYLKGDEHALTQEEKGLSIRVVSSATTGHTSEA
jgi:cytochrome c peroxidase